MTQTNDVIAQEALQLAALWNISGVLQQMYNNLALISEGATGKVITVINVSLFQLAAQEYGDATAWTTIAEANGLSDPMITTLTTLTIPSTNNQTGGILIQ